MSTDPAAKATRPGVTASRGARVVAISNQKGGEGKTTTAVNLAASLAAVEKRVLLVDLDPQGNASSAVGQSRGNIKAGSYELLLGNADLKSVVQPTELPTLQVVPASEDLAGAEIEMVSMPDRETKLKDAIHTLKAAIAAVAEEYDYILIDCPPTLNLLTLNALCAADSVLIPMQCEYYALEGLSDLVNSIKKVHANLNRDLSIIGLLRVMFDPRVTLQQQVSAQLEAHFGNKVFKAIVPRNVRLAEAPSHGIPGVVFDRSAKGAQAYLAFAKEMIERVKTL